MEEFAKYFVTAVCNTAMGKIAILFSKNNIVLQRIAKSDLGADPTNFKKMAKNILRLTRHGILNPKVENNAFEGDFEKTSASAEKQLQDLKRIFGEDVNVHEILGFNAKDIVNDVRAEVEKIGEVEAIEIVLPANLLAELTGPKGKGLPKVIRAVMTFGERRPEGKPPAPAEFVRYELVKKVEVIVEVL